MAPSRDFRVVLSLAVFLIVSFPQFSSAQANGVPQRLDALEALVPVGQRCADGFFVAGFDGEGAL